MMKLENTNKDVLQETLEKLGKIKEKLREMDDYY